MTDLLAAESHFAFGKNWRSFAGLIDDQKIQQSDAGIARLFSDGELEGAHVLDIGCGSGLPALSLLRRGAAHVTCIDIDRDSVAAARQTLAAHAPPETWSAEVKSVFDLKGQYDVVYSWGVLHHTGDMWRAIRAAADLVRPGGRLAIALYSKTALCEFWKIEKRIYSRSARPMQWLIQRGYLALDFAARARRGRLRQEGQPRGMDKMHDVHDWLGGYPYESASPDEVVAALPGFKKIKLIESPGARHGLLGTGCDEFVFVKMD
jgi:SAM-dependent methyltransferase